jgi:hypothetical protein
VLEAPKTQEQALQQMRLYWAAFAVTIPIYLFAGTTSFRISWLNFQNSGKIFVALAALNLCAFSWALRKLYLPAKQRLQQNPENAAAVKRWMSSWMVLVCDAGAMSLYGFAFWTGNKTLKQSSPFFVIELVLMIFLWPRSLPSSPRIPG